MKAKKQFIRSTLTSMKRKLFIFFIAFMLGMSNAILEETRMVNDTRAKIELQALEKEDSEV